MPLLGASGEGISREDFIMNVSNDILQKMPKEYEIWRVRKYFQLSMTPSIIVLMQELERFNKLLSVMRRTLQQLKKALVGEIGMDAILDNVAYSLYNGQLPASWRKLAPDTRKSLGGWMQHFQNRQTQYHLWVRRNISFKLKFQIRRHLFLDYARRSYCYMALRTSYSRDVLGRTCANSLSEEQLAFGPFDVVH